MKVLTKYAKQHRKKPTKSELEFKKQLQRWKIPFRSQRPVDKYIVDFIIIFKKIIIEVDGGYHLRDEQIIKDRIRENYLRNKGFRILRITNEDVLSKNYLWLYNEIINTPDLQYDREKWREFYGFALF